MEDMNELKESLTIELNILKDTVEELWFKEVQPKILAGRPVDLALINEVVSLNARIDGIEWQLRRRRNKTLDYILNKGVEKYRKLMEKRPWKHHQ